MTAIHIIGLSVVADAELSQPALSTLASADLLIGSKRQLQLVARRLTKKRCSAECIELPKLAELKNLLDSSSAKTTVVLASGDPLFYGIGRWFSKHFAAEQLTFYPAVSSVQAGCHALGWSLQDVDVLSLHGRPLNKIRRQLQAQQRLAILTDKHSTPTALAKECEAAGLAESCLWVCENMGFEQQRIRQFSVTELLQLDSLDVDPLHITMIETQGRGLVLPCFPGIADDQYATGKTAGSGMITKREVRLMVLSFIQPSDGDIIWDLGAGCGGVSVELARWNERVEVYALEQDPERLNYLKQNSIKFGVSANLHPILGRAPDELAQLPAPNKVFIGGSDGELAGLLNHVWALLPLDGVLVVTAVTDKTKQLLEQFCRSVLNAKFECTELAVGRGELGENGFSFKQKRPVMVLKLSKISELG